MIVKHNLEQWIAQLDYDDTCDISDRQVSDLIRNYAALEARCMALAAENAGLKALARGWANATDDQLFEEHGEIFHDSIDACEEELKTICPITDAFLAEVRAQGVEMLREHQAIKLCSLTHVCDEFAAQLRKGVQS